MKHTKELQNNLLLDLLNPKLNSRRRIKILENIQVINSYELVFVLCAIVRFKFSGNLIVVNKHNDLSGIEFVGGDIVRVDYPDHENLLGNIIIKDEIISKHEMTEIISKTNGKKLGEFLVESKHISEEQLAKYLIRQARSRLNNYMNDSDLRVNFQFDGVLANSVMIQGKEYFDALHDWIFEVYKIEWLDVYRNFYARLNFTINIRDGMAEEIQKFEMVSHFFEILKKSVKKKVTYYDLINMTSVSIDDQTRLIHFMVLIGALVENKIGMAKQGNLVVDQFDEAKRLILQKKYFDALGVVNKISSTFVYDEKVHFYYLWIKLHGAFHKNNVLDLLKVKKEIAAINPLAIGLADYHYALALLEANLKNENAKQLHYTKAVGFDKTYSRFPVVKGNDSESLWSLFRRKINF